MKSRFKMLSLATAVLFATSCNKDDNSDSIVDAEQQQQPQQQEEVVVKERSITVTGKATTQSGLSKFDLTPRTEGDTKYHDITFSGGEPVSFVCTSDPKIHGEVAFSKGTTNELSLTIYYPAVVQDGVKEEQAKNEDGTPKVDDKNQPVMVTVPNMVTTTAAYLDGATLDFTIGTEPAQSVKACSTQTEMLASIYETATGVKLVVPTPTPTNGNGNDGNSTTSDPTISFEDGEIFFTPQVAIIENTSKEEIVILEGGVKTSIPTNQFAVVKAGKTITIQTTDGDSYFGSSENKQVEAKYYTINSESKHNYAD